MRRGTGQRVTTDGTFNLLLDLVESETGGIAPDSRRYSDERDHLDQLMVWTLVYPGPVAETIRCNDCCTEQAHLSGSKDHYYCAECGRLDIDPANCRSRLVTIDSVVARCAMGLLDNNISGITPHAGGHIWKLGVLRPRRGTTTVYFARHLHTPEVARQLRKIIERDSALTGHLVVTSTLPEAHCSSGLEGLKWKYLPDVATMSNGRIDFDWQRISDLRPHSPSASTPPTTLRFLRTDGEVYVDGKKYKLLPQERSILLYLIDDTDHEATKDEIKKAINSKANHFRIAGVFKRHPEVFKAFILWDEVTEVYELPIPACDIGIPL